MTPDNPRSAKRRPFIHEWRSAVFNSSLPASTRMALLALAEFANEHGSDCYPSKDAVARYSGQDEKTVRGRLRDAATAGWIEQHQRTGNGSGWARHSYILTLPPGADIRPARWTTGPGVAPAPIDQSSGNHARTTSGNSEQLVREIRPNGPGVAPDEVGRSRLVEATGEEKKAPDGALSESPSEKAPSRRKRNPQLTYDQWGESLREDEMAIPPEHAVFRYAEQIRLPDEYLALAWECFDRNMRGTDRKQKDWARTFQKYVENNWLKLWFIRSEDGQYALTVAGLQLQKLVAELNAKPMNERPSSLLGSNQKPRIPTPPAPFKKPPVNASFAGVDYSISPDDPLSIDYVGSGDKEAA